MTFFFKVIIIAFARLSRSSHTYQKDEKTLLPKPATMTSCVPFYLLYLGHITDSSLEYILFWLRLAAYCDVNVELYSYT